MRELFHVPDNYFLSHSVGCLPKSARHELDRAFLGPWESGTTWADWMPLIDTFRAGIGELLGVEAASICPQTNVSSGLTKIVYSQPFRPERSVIVLSRQDFPTIGFVMKQAERLGYRLRFIEGDPTDITSWKAAIDAETAFVHITHALSDSSHLLPVSSICALAKAVNATTIVDIAQSLGAVAVPVSAWDPDFVIGTGVKFLCAGPGACFLYARPDQIAASEPLDVGWFSHENPFEMDIGNFRYAADAMRFFGGTPSPAPLSLANAALDVWQSVDMSAVYARIQSQLNLLLSSISTEHLASPTRADARGATFVIKQAVRSGLHTELLDHGIQYDERKTGLRFSIHGYTSDAEIERLASLIAKHI